MTLIRSIGMIFLKSEDVLNHCMSSGNYRQQHMCLSRARSTPSHLTNARRGANDQSFTLHPSHPQQLPQNSRGTTQKDRTTRSLAEETASLAQHIRRGCDGFMYAVDRRLAGSPGFFANVFVSCFDYLANWVGGCIWN